MKCWSTNDIAITSTCDRIFRMTMTSTQRALLKKRSQRQPSVRRLEGLRQDQILRSPPVRTLWDGLLDSQQALVLNPDPELGKRYPLTTGELSGLTGMSTRQVQYWSERRLLPHWLDQRGHRRFEAAAAIVAFALSDSKQHDRQHYADIAADSQPLAAMRRAVGVVGLSALSSSEQLDPNELERTEQTLRLLADELQQIRKDSEISVL
jgi:DNA-binding transcriptional MerR regulator